MTETMPPFLRDEAQCSRCNLIVNQYDAIPPGRTFGAASNSFPMPGEPESHSNNPEHYKCPRCGGSLPRQH